MVAVTRTRSTISVRRGSRVPVVRQDVRRITQILTTRTTVIGSGTSYTHNQASAADSWIVNHNLGRRPAAVSVLSPGGVEVDAGVTHVTDNQLTVEFASPQVGSVRVS